MTPKIPAHGARNSSAVMNSISFESTVELPIAPWTSSVPLSEAHSLDTTRGIFTFGAVPGQVEITGTMTWTAASTGQPVMSTISVVVSPTSTFDSGLWVASPSLETHTSTLTPGSTPILSAPPSWETAWPASSQSPWRSTVTETKVVSTASGINGSPSTTVAEVFTTPTAVVTGEDTSTTIYLIPTDVVTPQSNSTSASPQISSNAETGSGWTPGRIVGLVGGVMGGVLAVIGLLLVLWRMHRRKGSEKEVSFDDVEEGKKKVSKISFAARRKAGRRRRRKSAGMPVFGLDGIKISLNSGTDDGGAVVNGAGGRDSGTVGSYVSANSEYNESDLDDSESTQSTSTASFTTTTTTSTSGSSSSSVGDSSRSANSRNYFISPTNHNNPQRESSTGATQSSHSSSSFGGETSDFVTLLPDLRGRTQPQPPLPPPPPRRPPSASDDNVNAAVYTYRRAAAARRQESRALNSSSRYHTSPPPPRAMRRNDLGLGKQPSSGARPVLQYDSGLDLEEPVGFGGHQRHGSLQERLLGKYPARWG